jgi:hypothetical protein
MRSRIVVFLLFLALPMLLGAQAPPSPAPATPAPALCSVEAPVLSTLLQEGLPASIKPPIQRCGPCSLNDCANSQVFSRCGGTVNHFCVDSGTCPADGSLYCVCGPAQ